MFRSLNTAGGDNTALIDAVQINYVAPPPVGAVVVDGGFETPSQSSQGFTYRPSGSAWTFTGTTGLTANGSGFTNGNPAAPQGSQVAFLQGSNGRISQNVMSWTAGRYTIQFKSAKRGNYGGSNNFRVLVEGVAVSTFNPTSTGYQSFATAAFDVAAGNHTITFESINSSGGDNTSFIDDVQIVNS
jgi:Protein of unknown function (DUF642)